jgi:FLVCR family feline leukemia virus subgroup C receptor-related protein
VSGSLPDRLKADAVGAASTVASAVASTPMLPGRLRASRLRWLILALFVFYSASNAFQWTQLVIISSILVRYYDVSMLAVSWTSIIYMVTYIPLIFPASWFLQKKVMSDAACNMG